MLHTTGRTTESIVKPSSCQIHRAPPQENRDRKEGSRCAGETRPQDAHPWGLLERGGIDLG
jgi:hypothetical protein